MEHKDSRRIVDPSFVPTALPEIPVRDDFAESGSIARGHQFLNVLHDAGVDVTGRAVVDLGAGFGSISLAAASRATSVVAVDVHDRRLAAIRQRASASGLDVRTHQMNLLDSRGVPKGDLAVMVGVVEYAGLWASDHDVEALQVKVLRTARSALDRDGTLVLATKNRSWPKSLVRDVHTGQPLVAALPRATANVASRLTGGSDYRHWIHTPTAWRALLNRADFSRVETYVPLLGYQFPVALTSRPVRGDVTRVMQANVVDGLEKDKCLGGAWRSKLALSVVAARLGLEVSQSVLFIARP